MSKLLHGCFLCHLTDLQLADGFSTDRDPDPIKSCSRREQAFRGQCQRNFCVHDFLNNVVVQLDCNDSLFLRLLKIQRRLREADLPDGFPNSATESPERVEQTTREQERVLGI